MKKKNEKKKLMYPSYLPLCSSSLEWSGEGVKGLGASRGGCISQCFVLFFCSHNTQPSLSCLGIKETPTWAG